MKRSIPVIIAVIVLCAAVFLSIRYFNYGGEKNNIGQISEKDFATTISGSLKPGPEDKIASRRVYTPIRLKISDINNVMGIVTVPDLLFRSAVPVILILMILVAISFIRERINKPIALSPYERAMKALAQADPEKARPVAAPKEIYFLISRVIREYLKDSLDLGAKEVTAREFSAKVDEITMLPDDIRSAAKDLILRCDLIKFSGAAADMGGLKNDLETAKELVGAVNTALTTKGDNR
ncbi:MAG: hypothetical protein WC404_05240 [Candidatus Omnitrophota bacterium]|jgi:hypothetical protein